MSYDIDALQHYLDVIKGDLIPCHPYNKMIKGVERGKTPLHNEWTTREYKQNRREYERWAKQGYNIAYRIGKQGLVIDLDPRNYELDIDSELELAKLFGFDDFDDLLWELPVVRTGGGGYHIYCKLPNDIDPTTLRKCIKELPGLDFKRSGGKIIAAGSRHPNGKWYQWENRADFVETPTALLELITRANSESKYDASTDYKSGYGAFNGSQLYDFILSQLDVLDYADNDSWLQIMMASHHATAGNGIDEFLDWSLGDPEYSGCENIIRNRWESVNEDYYGDKITVATLIHELKQHGQDTKDARALLDFCSQPDFTEIETEEKEESDILAKAQQIGANTTAADVYDIDKDVYSYGRRDGMAAEMASSLSPSSNKDEVMQCLRLIKVADLLEREDAINKLIAATGKKYSRSTINKILKDLDSTIIQDIAATLSNKALEEVFNHKRHILTEPNESVWIYNKTHWIEISNKYLEKIVRHTLNGLRLNMDISADETALIKKATELTKMETATIRSKLHRTGAPDPIISCKNCEIHIRKDGSHVVRDHSYRSYATRCLNTNYDPSATAPLFMQTLKEIFEDFSDTDDMVRHIGEIFGYLIQPYKNLSAWWLFLGPGGDGKTTLTSILEGVLGDAFTPGNTALINAKQSNSDNHAMTSLVGALALVIGDFKKGAIIDDERVKEFADNKVMESNPKGKDRFKFMYSAGLIVCSNHLPKTTDNSHGFCRRVNVVPFNAQFSKGGREDFDRKERILGSENEVAGILNFMLEGLQRLRNRGKFKPPQSCVEATEKWMAKTNNTAKFAADCIDITGDMGDCLGEFSYVYTSLYLTWCNDNEVDTQYRLGKLSFKEKLGELGLRVKKGGRNTVKVYGAKLQDGDLGLDFEDSDGF